MKRILAVVLTGAALAAAAATPSLALERGQQGGIANPNNLAFMNPQRTMRQQQLLNEMRRLRAEVKAERARNGGVLPADSPLQQRMDALTAEYRAAS